jgi:phosphotransferase system  glucose/maltose/N-acetylglucosamine-specific IIC component
MAVVFALANITVPADLQLLLPVWAEPWSGGKDWIYVTVVAIELAGVIVPALVRGWVLLHRGRSLLALVAALVSCLLYCVLLGILNLLFNIAMWIEVGQIYSAAGRSAPFQ